MSFYLGLLHWDKSKERCLVPRGWSEGEWHTIFALGRLEFRAKDYTCDPNFKLDPQKFERDATGAIVPRLTDY